MRFLNPFVPQPDRRSELVMARQAMACEFSASFPAGIRNAVSAGYEALDEVERLERMLSVYREDSEVVRLNRCGSGAVDREVYGLLRWAVHLSAATGGTFDAATGALTKTWGFFRGPKRVPAAAEIATALAASGSRHVHLNDAGRTIRFDRTGVEFNLGAIGKGFAIDCALHLMRTRYRIFNALMQGGQSSIGTLGCWTVAIGHPLLPGRTFAHVRLKDRAMGTSADTNQFFQQQGRRYGHILDPRIGWPARGVLSASAVAPTATEADALSTAFFVMGVEGTRRFCARYPQFGAVLMTPAVQPDAAPEVHVLGAVDVEVMV